MMTQPGFRAAALAIVFLLMAVIPLVGQSAADTPDAYVSFRQELQAELAAAGWDAAARERLLQQLDDLDWEGMERASAPAVALGLSYARERGSLDSELEMAQLAIEIARSSAAMAAVGLAPREIALASVRATRSVLDKRGGGRPDLREQAARGFQALAAAEMQQFAQQQSQAAAGGRAREQVRRALSGLAIPGAPQLPAGGMGDPDDQDSDGEMPFVPSP